MYGIFKAKSKGKSGQQLELGDIAILKCCTWINLSRSREREGEGEGVEYLGSEDARDVALQGKPKPHTTSDKLKAQISLTATCNLTALLQVFSLYHPRNKKVLSSCHAN